MSSPVARLEWARRFIAPYAGLPALMGVSLLGTLASKTIAAIVDFARADHATRNFGAFLQNEFIGKDVEGWLLHLACWCIVGSVVAVGVSMALLKDKERELAEVLAARAGRTLSAAVRASMIEALAPFPPTSFAVVTHPPSAEGSHFADQLISTLQDAGWHYEMPPFPYTLPAECYDVAIYSPTVRLFGHGVPQPNPSVDIMVEILNNNGIAAYHVWMDTLPYGVMLILVHPSRP